MKIKSEIMKDELEDLAFKGYVINSERGFGMSEYHLQKMVGSMNNWKKYDYKAVNLPRSILDEVDKAVENDPFIRSRAEFVKRAIEDKLKP